jgi:hypothetical protein
MLIKGHLAAKEECDSQRDITEGPYVSILLIVPLIIQIGPAKLGLYISVSSACLLLPSDGSRAVLPLPSAKARRLCQ